MNLDERIVLWLEIHQQECEERDLLNDSLEEIERLRGGIKDVVAERDEARLLAGALLDRVMEVEEILGCRKDAWKSSLVAKWPWLECGRDAAGGGE